MRKFVFVAAAFLAGCGIGLTQAEKESLTPAQSIFKLAGEVNIAFEPAVAYASQPKCTPTNVLRCHDPEVVKVLLQLREQANVAFAIARGNPDAAAIAVLANAIRLVLAELQTELLKTKTQGASYDRRNRFAIA